MDILLYHETARGCFHDGLTQSERSTRSRAMMGEDGGKAPWTIGCGVMEQKERREERVRVDSAVQVDMPHMDLCHDPGFTHCRGGHSASDIPTMSRSHDFCFKVTECITVIVFDHYTHHEPSPVSADS